MSDLHNRYIAGKKPAEITHNVVTDICRGRINGVDLKSLISELENKGILDDTVIKTSPKNEWNDKYLELLAYESVGGTFSKQYLLHLAEVADYVQANSKARNYNKSNKNAIIMGIVVIGLVTLGIILITTLLKGKG